MLTTAAESVELPIVIASVPIAAVISFARTFTHTSDRKSVV